MESQRLKDTWAKELLGLHLEEIQAAQKALKDAVETANSSLKKSRIARLVAAEVGYPDGSIMVDPTGAILIPFKVGKKVPKVEGKVTTPKVIEVTKAKAAQKAKVDTGKREWKSDLPTLDVLRAQAEARGVDITHLGRKRKDIHALLQSTETPTGIQLVKMDTEVNTEVDTEVDTEVNTEVESALPASVGQSSDPDEDGTKSQTVVRRRRKKVVDLATAVAKTDSVDLDQILEG